MRPGDRDEPEVLTWGRTELLRLRGYDEATIQGAHALRMGQLEPEQERGRGKSAARAAISSPHQRRSENRKLADHKAEAEAAIARLAAMRLRMGALRGLPRGVAPSAS
jgi:hypothetical protein